MTVFVFNFILSYPGIATATGLIMISDVNAECDYEVMTVIMIFFCQNKYD